MLGTWVFVYKCEIRLLEEKLKDKTEAGDLAKTKMTEGTVHRLSL